MLGQKERTIGRLFGLASSATFRYVVDKRVLYFTSSTTDGIVIALLF